MTPEHFRPTCWCHAQHGIPGIPVGDNRHGLCRECAERTPEECSAAHAQEQQQGKEAG